MNWLELFGSESPQRFLESKKREGMNAMHHTCEEDLFQ